MSHGSHLAQMALAIVIGMTVAAAAETTPTVTAAQALQQQHRPREAIGLYSTIIDRDRYDLESAAPALVGLVTCFQLLHGDPQAEQDYQRLAAKYLTDPPPLDGSSRLDPELAREELLWKRWDDPSHPAFKVSQSSRERALRDGKRVSILDLHLSPLGSDVLPLSLRPEDQGEAQGFVADGSFYSGTIRADMSSGALELQVEFTDVPATVHDFTCLSGECYVTLVKHWLRQELPLYEGVTWPTSHGLATLVSIQDDGRTYRIEVSVNCADRQAVEAAATEFAPRIWLKGVDGASMRPNQRDSFPRNATDHLTIEVVRTEAAQRLIWEEAAAVSTRPVSFSLDGIAIP